MVVGLDIFSEFFNGFENTYILIGGTATGKYFEEKNIKFRTTKDLDIILIAEAITPAFVTRFWEFIEKGEYSIAQKSQGKQCFYRFVKPQTTGFPYMLELFSRLPDVITLKEGMRFTPIPVDDDIPSLSAILMDEEYYQFTLANTQVADGVHFASEQALICLKAKAYLDLTERKAKGEKTNSDDISKHRSDVIKFTATIDRTPVNLPPTIAKDLDAFAKQIERENPDIKEVLKQASIYNTGLDEILALLRQIFQLTEGVEQSN
jgi:hypothetical protein